jgi:hypothetical protein
MPKIKCTCTDILFIVFYIGWLKWLKSTSRTSLPLCSPLLFLEWCVSGVVCVTCNVVVVLVVLVVVVVDRVGNRRDDI